MEIPRSQHILIVEDDTSLVRLLSAQLAWAGYTTHAESAAMSAVAYATTHPPNLILLDLKLPDRSGYEVCKDLRDLYSSSGVPIVIISGLAQPIDQLRGFACGADAYLTKPFDLTDLLNVVKGLLSENIPG